MDTAKDFEKAPPLPLELSKSVCIGLTEEVLICGAISNPNCFSYSTRQQSYRFITTYPERIWRMRGHIVVKCKKLLSHECEIKKEEEEGEEEGEWLLLSFGGQANGNDSHTLWMRYESVWKEGKKKEGANKWKALMNGKTKQAIELSAYGSKARACVGGEQGHLLFVIEQQNIDILDLHTCQYVLKSSQLPHVFSSSLLMVPLTHKNIPVTNHFLVMEEEHSLLFKFDEVNASIQWRTFKDDEKEDYENTHKIKTIKQESIQHENGHLQMDGDGNNDSGHFRRHFGYVCLFDHIITMGGVVDRHATNHVAVYSMATKQWTLQQLHLPVHVYALTCVATSHHMSIHCFGGRNPIHQVQAYHFSIPTASILRFSRL
ncbi:hypothetical protein RFI_25985, partial [Reticulomyxa filosa]